MFVDFTNAGRASLDAAVSRAPDHFVPLLKAVRDHGCAFSMVAQSPQRFTVPETGPALAIVGDDLLRSLGPPGFHVRSLRRLLTRSRAVAVMAGAPVVTLYARMAREAVERRIIVTLIETQIPHEAEWIGFVDEVAPGAEVHIASPSVRGLH